MSYPTFLPVTSNLGTVRLYTETDAYHYTVDNRPLEDLLQNVAELSSASDAGRRATLIEALCNTTFQAWFTGTGAKLIGFKARNLSTGVIGLGPGILLDGSNALVGGQISVNQKATLLYEAEVQTPFPYNAGMERKFLIQIRYADLGSGTATVFEDTSNPYMASSTLNGKVEINVLSTGEVPVGTGVTPTATAGWTPLYAVTCVYGDTTSTIGVANSLTWHSDDFFTEIQSMVDSATQSATSAQTALDSIQLSSGIYSSTAEGVAAVTNGAYFSVPSPDSHEYLILYRKMSGAATEIKRYPSAQAVITSLVTSGIFTTTTEGLAKTTDGMYFSVPSPDVLESVIIYRNNAGVATEVKRYPSAQRFDDVSALVTMEANRAETARDAAQLSAGIYIDTASGIAATTSGHYFSVPSPVGDEYLILYLNSSGTATEIKRYPSSSMLTTFTSLKDAAATSETNAAASATAAGVSATDAASSATESANSSTAASGSATDAANSATAAAASAQAAATSELNASNSAIAADQSRADALASASSSLQSAADAANSYNQTVAISTQTAGYVAQAISARDAALVNGDVYDSTTAGLAATINGQYFSVLGATVDDYMTLYQNVSGSAVLVKTYPTASKIESSASEAQLNATQAQIEADKARSYAIASSESMVGLASMYATKAEAEADLPNRLAGDRIMVLADESYEGRTVWYLVSKADTTTTLDLNFTTDSYSVGLSVDTLSFLKVSNGVNLVTAPATSTDPGTVGDMAVTSNYLYVAVGLNSWKRITLESF